MSATLRVGRRTIGVEVRRGAFDVLVDGQRVGSVAVNDSIEIPVDTGRHTVQVRNGRNSSAVRTFDAPEERTVAF